MDNVATETNQYVSFGKFLWILPRDKKTNDATTVDGEENGCKTQLEDQYKIRPLPVSDKGRRDEGKNNTTLTNLRTP